MRRCLFVLAAVLVCLTGARLRSQSTLTTVMFTASTASIINPERGFQNWVEITTTNDAFVRTAGNSLARLYYRLDSWRTAALPGSFLTDLADSLDVARTAGIKIIPRFMYNAAGGDPDATTSRIASHLTQLASVLSANVDVIAGLEAGFVGEFGEWHTSTNGTDSPTNEQTIVDAIMAALPTSRAVLIRYPSDLRRLQATGPITSGEAFSGTARARLGSHQDCFLASADDFGTWGVAYDYVTVTWPAGAYTAEEDKDYIAANGLYAPVGGETCNSNPPRSDCTTALAELARLHWTYLNAEYEPTVLGSWMSGGCYTEIANKLGYRLRLTSASYTTHPRVGGSLYVEMSLVNDGYAAPINARPAILVLKQGATVVTSTITSTEIRRWAPGGTISVTHNMALPNNIPTGAYSLSLWLPDAASGLQSDSRYAIQLANVGTWDAATGYNALVSSVTVEAAGGRRLLVGMGS